MHKERAGKPSLVLDLMEEYRSWVVDRNVIKMRAKISNDKKIDAELKKYLSNQVHETMSKKLNYKNKRLRLETIMQRQIYKLASSVVKNNPYKSYRFLW